MDFSSMFLSEYRQDIFSDMNFPEGGEHAYLIEAEKCE
jgi:hypothetical protein